MQIQKNIESLLIYLNILVVQQIETSNFGRKSISS